MDESKTAAHIDMGALLLADVSGYSVFLESVTAAHPEMLQGEVPPAFPAMSSLLDVVVQSLAPHFELSEIEGDAVFAYAPMERLGGESTPVELIRSAYSAFRRRVVEVLAMHMHDCSACIVFPTLELKFVLHHGRFVVQEIAGRDRLLGPDVNLAHRLLKNGIEERTGWRAYLFLTEPAAAIWGAGLDSPLTHREEYPDVEVSGVVVPLGS